MYKIIQTTDYKFIGVFIMADQVFKGNTIMLDKNTEFEISEIIPTKNTIILANPNYIVHIEAI